MKYCFCPGTLFPFGPMVGVCGLLCLCSHVLEQDISPALPAGGAGAWQPHLCQIVPVACHHQRVNIWMLSEAFSGFDEALFKYRWFTILQFDSPRLTSVQFQISLSSHLKPLSLLGRHKQTRWCCFSHSVSTVMWLIHSFLPLGFERPDCCVMKRIAQAKEWDKSDIESDNERETDKVCAWYCWRECTKTITAPNPEEYKHGAHGA